MAAIFCGLGAVQLALHRHYCNQGQQQGQDANIAAGLHIVLDPPKDAVHVYPLSGDYVPIAVVGRIPEKARQQEGEYLAGGVRPSNDVRVADRALAEILRDQLEQWDKLHGAETQTEAGHESEPQPQA